MVIYNGKKGFSFPKALAVHGFMYLAIAALFFALGVSLNSGKSEVRVARVYIPYRVMVIPATNDDFTVNRGQVYQTIKYYMAVITHHTEQIVNKMIDRLEWSIFIARARYKIKAEVLEAFYLTP